MSGEAGHDPIRAFWEGRWRSGQTPWDHGQAAPPFVEFVERCGAPSGRVLIPGPGSGHDVRFFAELGASVTGVDIAPAAIKAARRQNPHPNAEYLLGNILDPDPAWHGQFDWVVEHTCLCAIEPAYWDAYARAVPLLLKPQGCFLAIFYRNPHDDAGPPFRIDAATIDRLFGADFELLQAWVPRKAYPSRAGREELRWYQRRA